MSLKLKHIVLFAENLEQQKAYYRDVLGLPVKFICKGKDSEGNSLQITEITTCHSG
jgi:catechol 2,3-dioxygenase-like lactoylglutathione lyase family enzyme